MTYNNFPSEKDPLHYGEGYKTRPQEGGKRPRRKLSGLFCFVEIPFVIQKYASWYAALFPVVYSLYSDSWIEPQVTGNLGGAAKSIDDF